MRLNACWITCWRKGCSRQPPFSLYWKASLSRISSSIRVGDFNLLRITPSAIRNKDPIGPRPYGGLSTQLGFSGRVCFYKCRLSTLHDYENHSHWLTVQGCIHTQLLRRSIICLSLSLSVYHRATLPFARPHLLSRWYYRFFLSTQGQIRSPTTWTALPA